jgi:hypothetical protein
MVGGGTSSYDKEQYKGRNAKRRNINTCEKTQHQKILYLVMSAKRNDNKREKNQHQAWKGK